MHYDDAAWICAAHVASTTSPGSEPFRTRLLEAAHAVLLHGGRCSHASRDGRHEVYFEPGGVRRCRACGRQWREPAAAPPAEPTRPERQLLCDRIYSHPGTVQHWRCGLLKGHDGEHRVEPAPPAEAAEVEHLAAALTPLQDEPPQPEPHGIDLATFLTVEAERDEAQPEVDHLKEARRLARFKSEELDREVLRHVLAHLESRPTVAQEVARLAAGHGLLIAPDGKGETNG